jgi:16S rRNA (cytosine967-C5)-methyltransferase
MLAYCTCSIVEEENEAQVAEFVSDAPRWRVVCERRWPVSDAGDGFFLSVLIDN